jgi:replicative DNA helicase
MTAALPWAPEAEQSLLGALLNDSDTLLRIADRRLKTSDLYDHRHRVILASITDMHARRQPVDIVTVFEHLRDRGQAEDAGGLAYLNELAVCVPSQANAGRYADAVIDKASRRAMLSAADQARELALEPGDAGAALDKIETLFAGLRVARGSKSVPRVSDLLEERSAHWQALADGTAAGGISTGLPALDHCLGGGLKPGRNLVVAARPSTGKTSLAGQISCHVAKRQHPVLVLSMEMPAGDLIDRVVANLGQVPLGQLTTGRLTDRAWAGVAEGADAARSLPLYIDDQPALTLLDIRAKARQVQQQAGGLALVVVDYLQLAASTGTFDKRHHQIEAISRGMKTLAKELGTTVLLLSQLTRESEREEPELHHLKESGAIEEDADVVMLLHAIGDAPEGGTLVLCKVAKNRQGPRGRFGLAFDGSTQTWQQSTGDVKRRRGGGST